MQGEVTIIHEALTLYGTGVGGAGALENVSGYNFFGLYGGQLTLESDPLITSDSGLLQIGGTGVPGTYGGTITGSQNLTIDGAGNTCIASNISSGSLTKDGTGTLTLTGTNTYSGEMTINAGNLAFSFTSAIPGGNVKIN